MDIQKFTVDAAQELIASGDYRAHQQIMGGEGWRSADYTDPSGLYPHEVESTVYARSHIFAATDDEEQAWVGESAANDPKAMGPVIRGLLEGQNHFTFIARPGGIRRAHGTVR